MNILKSFQTVDKNFNSKEVNETINFKPKPLQPKPLNANYNMTVSKLIFNKALLSCQLQESVAFNVKDL